MTANEIPDTINVELPIEAHHDCYVSVTGVVSVSRETWREIAANPNATRNSIVRTVAPAVVAWMDRDEWKPLDLPEVGRRIQATLRDGAVETFKVGKVEDDSPWALVWKADSDDGARHIQRTLDMDDPYPTDITAWEYVDEDDPIKIPAHGSRISATFGDGSVHVIAVKWAARIGENAGVIQSSITQYRVGEWRDGHQDLPRYIVGWSYADEPAEALADIADKIDAAVTELREAIG